MKQEAVAVTARPMSEQAGVMSYREALYQTMDQALATDPRTIIFGQGVDDHKGTFGTTLGLASKYGASRVMDVPLAEEATTGIALGAGLNGLRPIHVHIRSDFSLLAMNQLVNLAAKYKYMFGGRMDAPMFVRLVIGRSWGQGAQHSQSLQALFAHIPGLTVIMPSSADMIVESYPYFISQYPGPVISLEHRLMYDLKFRHHDAPKRGEGFPRSSVLARTGSDVTIVATSIMVLESLRAAEHLKREAGIDCEVIDLHCVSHPDKRMILESVQKTGKLLVADTSWREYGVGAEVSRIVAEAAPASLSAPVVTMGMQPAPCPTAKSLEDLYYPNLTTLTDAVAGLARGRRDHGIPLPDEHSMADVYKKFKGPF